MNVRFSSKMLLTAFLPVGIVLTGTFIVVRQMVDDQTKASLRESINRTNAAAVWSLRDEVEMRERPPAAKLNLSRFPTPAVLTRGGIVIQSNLSRVQPADLEWALRDCPPAGECELTLNGELYLSSTLDEVDLGDGYRLRSLQSVTAASEPVQQTVRKVFWLSAFAAFGLITLLGATSVRKVTQTLHQFTGRFQESQRRGTVVDLNVKSKIVEIDELTKAFNGVAQMVRDGQTKLSRAYMEFLEAMASAMDARDVYTAGHSRRVADYACAIASALDLSEDDVKVVRVGALLHDIGKIGVPDSVLLKPTSLTTEETHAIKLHPTIGRVILQRITGFQLYIPIVELHHENFDGSGYPYGLKGEDIPLFARIVHVADAYDAMTSDRPYRPGRLHGVALDEMKKFAGTQFDPYVLSALIASGAARPLGQALGEPSLADYVHMAQSVRADQPEAPVEQPRQARS